MARQCIDTVELDVADLRATSERER